VHGLFIALIIEAVHTSETSVYFNETTWRYVPEGCLLHTDRRENLKPHVLLGQVIVVQLVKKFPAIYET
jgi:hypothetical protein